MRIVLTGSGSGGHFYPLIAIAEAIAQEVRTKKLLAPDLYLLAPEPYDEEALFANAISYRHVPAGKMRRYFSLANITDTIRTFLGIFSAIWKLFVLYPDVVISKGSYTSVPVVLAAAFLRIPLVIHESDVRAGRANALAARFARVIAVSYEASIQQFPPHKTIRTGIPVRSRLLKRSEEDPYATLKINPRGGPLILILGGSQGAEHINDLIATSLDTLLPAYTILHQAGEQHVRTVTETAQALTKQKDLLGKYHVRGFLDAATLQAAFSAAAVVVSRAGSGSIYETALAGKPSVLIPIPETISHDQRLNAYAYARTGAAVVMEEKNMTPHLLAAEIGRILNTRGLKERMSAAALAFAPRDAAEKIASILLDIVLEHEPR